MLRTSQLPEWELLPEKLGLFNSLFRDSKLLISVDHIKDLGINWTILGHSERR